jgi:hypothetical protein
MNAYWEQQRKEREERESNRRLYEIIKAWPTLSPWKQFRIWLFCWRLDLSKHPLQMRKTLEIVPMFWHMAKSYIVKAYRAA